MNREDLMNELAKLKTLDEKSYIDMMNELFYNIELDCTIPEAEKNKIIRQLKKLYEVLVDWSA